MSNVTVTDMAEELLIVDNGFNGTEVRWGDLDAPAKTRLMEYASAALNLVDARDRRYEIMQEVIKASGSEDDRFLSLINRYAKGLPDEEFLAIIKKHNTRSDVPLAVFLIFGFVMLLIGVGAIAANL